DGHGHMEMDRLFELGGVTLVSGILILGWLIGRFPLIATLVLMSGIFSTDRHEGYARLYAVRPRSLILLYAARFALFSVVAFIMSALLMPAFDFLVLGEWGGPTVFVLIAAQIIVFGVLTALLSVFTRADAWIALFLGILAMVWDGLRRVDYFAGMPAFLREVTSVVLPPQGALMRIELAFGSMLPVPWEAFLYILIYGTLVLLLAGVALARRTL
ncbi:MAG TPA: hypothetical protein VK929_08530, partial [Longimicrobiales bacterium]|nr:hypothetical protein [Longimicrobiales bacterium]